MGKMKEMWIEMNESLDETHCSFDDSDVDTRKECACNKCLEYIDTGANDDDMTTGLNIVVTCPCWECKDKEYMD
jgi:hypothetical protein